MENRKKLKFIFIIQGEGRGHLTQAISMFTILTQAGHQVSHVLVGKSERRKIPAFFYEKINTQIDTFESPNFVADSKGKGVKLFSTIFFNLRKFPVFLRSLRFLKQTIKTEKPDVIVNFYDFLGGLYNLIYKKSSFSFVSIGHQYFLQHSDFQFPENNFSKKTLLKMNNKVTSFRCDKKLALSFREAASEPHKKLSVVPALLRKEVRDSQIEIRDYILVYINMVGYAEEIIEWHKNNTDTVLHCFWDKKETPDGWQPHENLTFHQINDIIFLEYMRTCKGYVSTAGFESVCEAMYLGKPVMMIPIEGQFEQTCNAIDAIDAHAGISSDAFNISLLLEYLPKHIDQKDIFQKWINKAENLFLKELENI